MLHIVGGGLGGGAAMGARFLHDALLKQGIQSSMLIQYGDDEKNGIYSIGKYLDNTSKKIHQKHFFAEKNCLNKILFDQDDDFSIGISGNKITQMDIYQEADIVHFHWINNGMLSIREIKNIKKPIVWTLRDMWPFTGGCHYSLLCEQYKNGCTECHLADSAVVSKVFRMKKRTYSKNIVAVGISEWIRRCAEDSGLFEGGGAYKISNFIDFDEFSVRLRKESKRELGLSEEIKILSVGAQHFIRKYKGFDLLIEILNKLDKRKYFLLIYGGCTSQQLSQIKLNYKYMGYIQERSQLNTIYSASDVFLFTSIQETFGKSILEAMASGTPVVSFEVGGSVDIIEHKKNGYLSKSFDIDDFIVGIDWCLGLSDDERAKMSMEVRKRFDAQGLSEQYISLYKKILNKDC